MNKYIISMEPTPNPNSYKFIINHSFMGDDMWECDSETSASVSGLAQSIWQLNLCQSNNNEPHNVQSNITRIFFYDNMIVIHKSPEKEWHEIDSQLIACIEQHFKEGNSLFKNKVSDLLGSDEDADIIKLISEVIKDYIQPGVASHGGFVQLQSFSEGIAYISMHGACDGCPSSEMTLKNGIESLLKFYVPGLLEVKLNQS